MAVQGNGAKINKWYVHFTCVSRPHQTISAALLAKKHMSLNHRRAGEVTTNKIGAKGLYNFGDFIQGRKKPLDGFRVCGAFL